MKADALLKPGVRTTFYTLAILAFAFRFWAASFWTVMRYRTQCSLILVAFSIAATVLFWWPLYGGAGFIGGDLYPYFFPQKAFYADCLKAGRFPLWNDLSGFGYPVLGESQTGAAYPFHIVLYRFLDLNTAYNVEHLLHYVICFVATGLFAKRVGITTAGSCLTALVFTYGWFPSRACLEWAILTGAWLPVALWCVESFLQTRWWRYLIGMSFAMGLQLLAGHFHLAFLTQLLVVTYAGWRLLNERRVVAMSIASDQCLRCRKRAVVGLSLSLTGAACLAAIQLLPTWELKQRSSRVVVAGSDYDPAYGHLPPVYISQLVAPWKWYSLSVVKEDHLIRDVAEFSAPWHWFGPLPSINSATNEYDKEYDLDEVIQKNKWGGLSTGTNKVEAHLYCGLLPVWLAFASAVIWFLTLRSARRRLETPSVIEAMSGYWIIVGILALVYATGALLPIGLSLPGFGFFRGPGRYGIITTLAVALLAGQIVGKLLEQISHRFLRLVVLLIVFGSTSGDLWLVSRMVKYTYMGSPPRISYRDVSEVRQKLLAEPTIPRLLAPGPNVCNLLGVSCVPWYLGIAPAEYVDPKLAMPPMPKPLANKHPTRATPELIDWLSRSGVTHVLNFEPLETQSWQAELVWKGIDPLLNRVWARQEPIYLYRFRKSQTVEGTMQFPGRAYLSDGDGRVNPLAWKTTPAELRRYAIDTDSDHGNNEALVIVTELAYPGWIARSGGQVLESKNVGMFRAVDLSAVKNKEVQWTYEPQSVRLGAIISFGTLLLLAIVGHVRFWHPKFTDRFTETICCRRRKQG